MFTNYFKTAFRQLLKNKTFSIINIVGLSTGLASVLALSLLVYQYISANSNQQDIDQMYYLKTRGADGGGGYSLTPYPLLGEVVKKCPEVEGATHIQQYYFPWIKYGENEFQESTEFVDTGYFKVFSFPFKYGNAATAFRDKLSVVLSEETAEKFFGKTNPLGKMVTADDSLQLTVTGVLLHVPSNSSIRPTVLINTSVLEGSSNFRGDANWYNTFASNYLRLRKGSDPKAFDAKVAGIVKLNYPKDHADNTVFAEPFKNITNENSSLSGVIIKGAAGAGIFILLIVLVNLINLNTAGMYTRTKEVAIKQMMGSSKKSIVMQFCIENGLIVLISILFAWLIFSLLLLPTINDLIKNEFGEIETGLKKDYPIILLFTGIGILFTILAASLPAIKLTAVKVTDAVKGKIISGNYKNSLVRNTFITIQFVLAITLICVTIILNRQIRYMKSSSLGFNKEDVAVVSLNLAFRDQPSANARFVTIVNELKNNPHVRAVSVNGVIPTAYWENFNTYLDPVTNKEINMRQAGADAGYLQTFKIPLIEGKYFNDELGSAQEKGAYINRTAMNLLGWKTAVGKQIKSKGDEVTTYTVLGVMEDFHYRNLSGSIEPLIQSYNGKPSLDKNYMSIRTDAGYLQPIMKTLEATFKTMPSRRPFSYELMSNKVDKQYALFDGILKATNAIALLTILIASLGMFGLIALFAKLRVKEIGIRKVLGASVTGILQLLSKDFLMLVGVAILIATPVAWYLMNTWLRDFAYRINISWWMFAAAGFIAIFIAFFTISFQAIKAAMANPVKSLRTE